MQQMHLGSMYALQTSFILFAIIILAGFMNLPEICCSNNDIFAWIIHLYMVACISLNVQLYLHGLCICMDDLFEIYIWKSSFQNASCYMPAGFVQPLRYK